MDIAQYNSSATISCIMEDNRSVETETDVELELYEEIVGDLDYTTPV